jgi:hypothetical protein
MKREEFDRPAPVTLKYLRIAVTALSLTGCVLLIALWVISRGRYSGIEGHVGKQSFSLISSLGQLDIYLFTTKAVTSLPWRFTDSTVAAGEVVMPEHLGFEIYPNKSGLGIFVSYWLLVLMAGMAAAAPWLPRRFSLRTLLIATAVIAVGLGIAAVASAKHVFLSVVVAGPNPISSSGQFVS